MNNGPSGGKIAAWVVGGLVGFVLLNLVAALMGAGFTIFGAKLNAEVDTATRKDRETSQIQQPTNSIGAQERFESMFANVKTADQRIDVMAAALKADPDSVVAQTNMTGARNFCLQAVNDYDAEARKISAKEFRAVDLPQQIDTTNPATDCKETAAS